MGKMGGNHTLLNHCFQHLYGDLNAKLVEVVLLLGNVLATMMMKIGGIGRYEFPLPAFFLLTGARAGPQLLQFVQNNLHYVHFAMVHRALHTAKHIVHINVKWEEKSLVFSNLCIVSKSPKLRCWARESLVKTYLQPDQTRQLCSVM